MGNVSFMTPDWAKEQRYVALSKEMTGIGQQITWKEIASAIPPTMKSAENEMDKVTWSLSLFTKKSAWEDLQCRGGTVNWYKVVWFKNAIPRHSFILWLAIQLYLLRLMNYGIVTNNA